MLARLFLAFTLIPIIELYLLIKLGGYIGPEATIGLVLLTGFLGAILMRRQGVTTLQRIQNNIAQGISPAQELIDGGLILVAGIALLTPGIITDICGILLLVPTVRSRFKTYAWRKFSNMAQTTRFTIIH